MARHLTLPVSKICLAHGVRKYLQIRIRSCGRREVIAKGIDKESDELVIE